MASKNIYHINEKGKQLYSSSNTANARTQSTPKNSVWSAGQSAPRLQGGMQKNEREKSPSERGEEVLRLMLEEDMPKLRQTPAKEKTVGQALAGPAAPLSDPAAETGSGAAAASYSRTLAAPSGGAAPYSDTYAVPYDAATAPYSNTFTAPYGSGAAVPYGGANLGLSANRNRQPVYLPPATHESAAVQPLANARPSENSIQSTRWDNGLTSPLQAFGAKADPIGAAAAWQPPTAGQYPITAGFDENGPGGSQYGGSLYGLDVNGGFTGAVSGQYPITVTPNGSNPEDSGFGTGYPRPDENVSFGSVHAPTFEEVMSAAAPDLAAAGIDPNTMQAGFLFGDKVNQLIEDTHLAPGTSFKDYLWDSVKSGAWSGVEGAWNGLVDLSEAYEKSWLLMQNAEMQQQALLNEAYREQAERNNIQTKEALDELPEYAERFRSHKAAEYAQQIDELYDAGGLFKICGDVAAGIGQMAPTIAVNIATGGTGGMVYLYASASGNAAAEARANGADEETALLYGMLSGSMEVLTEQLGGGIPGLNNGVLDDWLMGMAQSNTGRAALKHLVNTLGEGAEEFISAIADAYFAKMWNGDERGFWETMGDTLPDAFYEGFIGSLTSAMMSIPGDVAEMRNAHTVDTAINTMQNGEIISDTYLARADAAMQSLIGDAGTNSPWSRQPAANWADTKNKFFDGLFSPAANPAGNTVDLSGLDTSNLIMFPTGSDLEALAHTGADSNAIPFLAAGNTAAAQNGQTDLSNIIHLPMGEELAALVNAGTDSDSISSLTAANRAAAQNGQPDLSNLIMLPMFDNPTAIQGNQTDSSNLIMLPMLNDSKPQANAAVGDNSILFPGANNAIMQNGQTGISETASQTGLSQNTADASTNSAAVSSSMGNGTAAAQNGPHDSANTIHLPTGEELAALANPTANPDAVSSSTANGATAQNRPFDLSNVISSLIGNEIAEDQNRSKAAGDNLQQTNPLHSAEIESKLLTQDIESGIDAQEREIEIREAEADERNGWIEQKNESLSKEEKSGMLSGQRGSNIPVTQNAMLSVSVPPSFRPNERLRIRVKEECQRALLRVKSLPLGTESTMLFNMNMVPIKNGIFVGEPGAGRVEFDAPSEPFILIHNHPNGETFSIDDIKTFLKDTGPQIMVAVGHNGKVYVLEKYAGFNSAAALELYDNFVEQYLSRAESVETYLASMEELIKGVEQYGASYYSGKSSGNEAIS